jgi:hypothetical protein
MEKGLNIPTILGSCMVQGLNSMTISCEHGNKLYGKKSKAIPVTGRRGP